jgi:hypothetical protein
VGSDPIYLIRATDMVKGGKRQWLKKTLADIDLSFFNLEIGIGVPTVNAPLPFVDVNLSSSFARSTANPGKIDLIT